MQDGKSLVGVGQPRCERTEPGFEFRLWKGESVDEVASSDSSDDEGRLLDEFLLSARLCVCVVWGQTRVIECEGEDGGHPSGFYFHFNFNFNFNFCSTRTGDGDGRTAGPEVKVKVSSCFV